LYVLRITREYDRYSKKDKNISQDYEAKAETSKAHAKGKPSSEKLNKAKVKVRDALS
jgi:hypothetical protein